MNRLSARSGKRAAAGADHILSSTWFAALILILPSIATTQPASAPLAGYPEPPQELFRELFVAVQSAAIYADGKDFADAVPKAAPPRPG